MIKNHDQVPLISVMNFKGYEAWGNHQKTQKMALFRLFLFLFLGLAILCFFVQLIIMKVCFIKDEDYQSECTCLKEKMALLHNSLDLSQEPACYELPKKTKDVVSQDHLLPIIFIITPTYARPVQKAELTRLSYTLYLVPKILWIVVEDSANKTSLVTNFLATSKVSAVHLNAATPEPLKTTEEDPNWLKPRGFLQRNRGLAWIRQHIKPDVKGVIYFADDDNTYDLKLFEEMRYTKTVSVWPVGLVGGLMVERPLVKDGKVVGWNTVWKADRPFPIDMAGFAVNASLLIRNKNAAFSARVPRGYQESKLLKDIVTIAALEPKAENCTKVLVWHTRTERPKLKQERKLTIHSNDGIEV